MLQLTREGFQNLQQRSLQKGFPWVLFEGKLAMLLRMGQTAALGLVRFIGGISTTRKHFGLCNTDSPNTHNCYDGAPSAGVKPVKDSDQQAALKSLIDYLQSDYGCPELKSEEMTWLQSEAVERVRFYGIAFTDLSQLVLRNKIQVLDELFCQRRLQRLRLSENSVFKDAGLGLITPRNGVVGLVAQLSLALLGVPQDMAVGKPEDDSDTMTKYAQDLQKAEDYIKANQMWSWRGLQIEYMKNLAEARMKQFNGNGSIGLYPDQRVAQALLSETSRIKAVLQALRSRNLLQEPPDSDLEGFLQNALLGLGN